MIKGLWFEIACLLLIGVLLQSCGPSNEQLTAQTANAATATFMALPIATSTRPPTSTSTPTETPTSTPTPKVNANNLKTEASTVGPMENPYTIEDYLVKYLTPLDQSSAVKGRNITEWTQKERSALNINSPGVYTITCDPTIFLEYIKNTGQYVTGVVPLPKAEDPCGFYYLSLQNIKDSINDFYPELKNEPTTEKFEIFLGDYLSMSAAFKNILSNGPIVIDTYNTVEITLEKETGPIVALFKTNPEPKKSDCIDIIYRPYRIIK